MSDDWRSSIAPLLGPVGRVRRTLRSFGRLLPKKIVAQEPEESSQRKFQKGTSGDSLVKCLEARGIAYRFLRNDEITVPRWAGDKILCFSINGTTYYCRKCGFFTSDTKRVPGPIIDGAAAALVLWKPLVNALLQSRGFSVPVGVCVPRSAQKQAETFFMPMASVWPHGLVVKPANGKWGRHVYVSIRDLKSFRLAFRDTAKDYDAILIEQMVTGTVYRFFCVAGRVVAIRYGRKMNVEGDGVHTVAALVELKNALRQANPIHGQILLRLRRKERKHLGEQGLEACSVPNPGQIVWLATTSNLHQGAEVVDATDDVHPSYVEIVERGVGCVDGLTICGADVAIDDASIPATSDNYHFIELNTFPGFSSHHYPWEGKPRDVTGAIVDHLMSRK